MLNSVMQHLIFSKKIMNVVYGLQNGRIEMDFMLRKRKINLGYVK